MKKLPTFLVGVFLGAMLMFVGLKYTVVRANNGFHLIGKSTAQLSTAYIDIREYTAVDWKDRIQLATDIANSENKELQEEVQRSALNNQLDSFLEQWQVPAP